MGGGVIGPRDNDFPGPAVALDGPGYGAIGLHVKGEINVNLSRL